MTGSPRDGKGVQRKLATPRESWQLYLGFDWTNENYALADRSSSADHFDSYEDRVLAGSQWWFSPYAAVELSGGYAFNRYFFETNQSFVLTGGNRIDVGSGPFAALQYTLRF